VTGKVKITRRQFLKGCALFGIGASLPLKFGKAWPYAQSPTGLRKFIQPLPGLGPTGIPVASPDTATFPGWDTETEYGWDKKVKMRVPIFTGALGSTDIARINWEHFAIGAAISGITCVCGENVCGVDPQLEFDSKDKVKKSPEMDRRINVFKKFHDGYGEILVQMNVEDTRLGTAEYVASKHNLDTIELKWAGAKCIGGEIKVRSLERAIELKKRGYIVLPDPSLKENQAAFKAGAIKEFERHSRLGFVTKEGFLEEIDLPFVNQVLDPGRVQEDLHRRHPGPLHAGDQALGDDGLEVHGKLEVDLPVPLGGEKVHDSLDGLVGIERVSGAAVVGVAGAVWIEGVIGAFASNCAITESQVRKIAWIDQAGLDGNRAGDGDAKLDRG
jgi:hypothetical protein